MAPGGAAPEKQTETVTLPINPSLQVWGWWLALQSRVSDASHKSH